MNRPDHEDRLSPRDRIAAFAEATEAYAERLSDPNLAKVYWGKSLGLRQALRILSAEDQTPAGPQLRASSPTRPPRRAGRTSPPAPRAVASPAAVASQGW